jgi:hypothetical protein
MHLLETQQSEWNDDLLRCQFLNYSHNPQIFDWNPEYYNQSSDFPHTMPEDLQNQIRRIPETDNKVS